jgi:hypothetical protein
MEYSKGSDSGKNNKGFKNSYKSSSRRDVLKPIHPSNNSNYTKLVEEADFEYSLGATSCFYVNKLSYLQMNELALALDATKVNPKIANKQKNNSSVNWISASTFTKDGQDPCALFKDALNIYNEFDIDEKRIAAYGSASISLNLGKLPLLRDENDIPYYHAGIFFFSDIHNASDNCAATITVAEERYEHAKRCRSIHPIYFSEINDIGNVSCGGNFRNRGDFIIFYASKDIIKGPELFNPDVTIINIPVITIRDRNDFNKIKATKIAGFNKRSICVSDVIQTIVCDIFTYYHADNQFVGEVIHAFGDDPVKYNFAPSKSDDRHIYYGKSVHVNDKNRTPQPSTFRHSTVFSYLDEINRNSDIKVVAKDEKPDKKEKIRVEESVGLKEETTAYEAKSFASEDDSPISEEENNNSSDNYTQDEINNVLNESAYAVQADS